MKDKEKCIPILSENTGRGRKKVAKNSWRQRDGRPAKHSWRPLFNIAKFG